MIIGIQIAFDISQFEWKSKNKYLVFGHLIYPY